jgi:hypothetical protein
MTIPSEIEYLYSIKSVRETNSNTLNLLYENKLTNFDVNLNYLPDVVDYVIKTIKLDFPNNESLLKIPIHGRYQHFGKGDENRLPRLINEIFKNQMKLSNYEICKRLIDLFIVSVLLDAGAGNKWKFIEKSFNNNNNNNNNNLEISRSEGIAIATYHMFLNGDFSNDPINDKYIVNGEKLANLKSEELLKGFQISNENPIIGFDGRLKLLNNLGKTLLKNKDIFKDGRPGGIVDYLKQNINNNNDNSTNEIDIEILWNALMKGLLPIWPTEGRTKIDGYVIGDAWPLMSKNNEIVTFHKLTQWLTYSLFKPLIEFGGFKILNSNYMTGLPEYRNGGLFVDFGILNLKPNVYKQGIQLAKIVGNDLPTYKPDDDVIVEWRSCTIGLLDVLLKLVNEKMKIENTSYQLTLPQLIEAGSWKSGRMIAAEKRANGGPPIELLADGTVF